MLRKQQSIFFVLQLQLAEIMEAIKQTFAQCKKEERPALVTYVTAGFPTTAETVDILLGMEAGGAGRPPVWDLDTTS